MAVLAGDGEHLRRDVLGQAVRQALAVGVEHLGDTGDLCRCGCRCGGVAGDEHMDVATDLAGCGHGVEVAPEARRCRVLR